MEVALFPNPRRPGIGLRPRREAQRPLLPQHARHCPVLEAGSTAGFLVHPRLAEKETSQIGYEGEGRYQFVYSVNTKGNTWEPVFTVTYLLPVGGIGATKREIKMHIQDTPQTREIAHLMPGMFISAEDMGTPAGAVTLRGAWNFQTPLGWDTVSYSGLQYDRAALRPDARNPCRDRLVRARFSGRFRASRAR
jgi:hypothetical protein